jgi:predicted enzyme related to lactoylglutathione lyase
MTDFKGQHVWFELNTTDLKAAEAFYASVMDWVPRDAGMPDMQYTLAGPADHAVAGMMALTDEMKAAGTGPGWTGYVAVDDVDAAAAHTQRLGGQVLVPPQDIPQVGRFAIVSDPQGTVLALFRGTPSEGMEPPPPPAPGTPGHIGWHELHTTSLDGALAFYGELFGWQKAETMDMGPNGVYQLFATGAQGAEADGGMVLKQAGEAQPYWLYYVNVASVDRAVARISAGGGQVLMGPHQVPGGSWIVIGSDPQGAAFAVAGPR